MTIAAPTQILHPLSAFFESAGRPLPEIVAVEASALPHAAYRLLAHAGDMTSKLEDFFADEMRLRVIQCEHTAEHYRREVVLYGAKSALPVEYGVIEIELGAFAEDVRAEIVAARLPLGGLLNRIGLRYRSEPRAFLRVSPCAWLTQMLDLPTNGVSYGRSNVLLGADDEVLARIVEILRPVD